MQLKTWLIIQKTKFKKLPIRFQIFLFYFPIFCIDWLTTLIGMSLGAIESNPIQNYIIQNFTIFGSLFFSGILLWLYSGLYFAFFCKAGMFFRERNKKFYFNTLLYLPHFGFVIGETITIINNIGVISKLI